MPKPLTPTAFVSAKGAHRRLSMVTCYDFTFARLLDRSPVDAILVGDSAAMVMHGEDTTLPATVDMIAAHTRAVVRGAPGKLVIADMPFLTCRKGVPAAMDAAHALMTAGAHALKVEGLRGHEDVIERLIGSGIPVMGHLGMQPQSVKAYGGFKVQGRREEAAEEIARQATMLEQLGAFGIVLECIPAALAARITASLHVPTIGIGAGVNCDGQVLVLQDLLGMNSEFRPRFSRAFCDGEKLLGDALAQFDEAVKNGTFPAESESFQ